VSLPAEHASSSLQLQLDEITANTRALVPPERLARTEQLVADLYALRLEDHLPSPGTSLPPFALPSASGRKVRSEDLQALGPLVLKFFRGRWDPYDMTELEAWQALQPALRERRALLVGISPQTPRQNAFTADRHHLSFPLLTDAACAYAETLGLGYAVPETAQTHFRSMLVNIPFLNGDNTWRLPLPATLVFDAAGTLLYAAGYADHRVRPEPAEALAVLPLSRELA
jgi:peroxiredoxin